MSDPLSEYKRQAAEVALQEVESGMRVGLGSGSTARFVIEGLAERVRAGMEIAAVPSSEGTARLAEALGIALVPLTSDGVDVAIDGTDEVDGQGRLIKGGGGALLREKLVAMAARRFVVVADHTKQVPQLGTGFALPVEIIPWGYEATLARLGPYRPTLRRAAGGEPFVSDNGNFVVDCATRPIADPAALHRSLKQLTGVVETGLFIDLASRVVLAGPDGITSYEL